MARQINTNGGGLVMRGLALVPWWAAIGLAVVSYAMLQSAANQPGSSFAADNDAQASLVLRSIAAVAQYVLPLLCIVLGGLAALHRDRSGSGDAAALTDPMNRREFDALMAEVFQSQGYQVVQGVTRSAGGFGPIDLMLRKNRETVLVDCRQWRAHKVGVEVVRSLHSVMSAQGVGGGIVVTAGRFSRQATAYARGRNVKLMDGPILHGLLTRAQSARSASPAQVKDC